MSFMHGSATRSPLRDPDTRQPSWPAFSYLTRTPLLFWNSRVFARCSFSKARSFDGSHFSLLRVDGRDGLLLGKGACGHDDIDESRYVGFNYVTSVKLGGGCGHRSREQVCVSKSKRVRVSIFQQYN